MCGYDEIAKMLEMPKCVASNEAKYLWYCNNEIKYESESISVKIWI